MPQGLFREPTMVRAKYASRVSGAGFRPVVTITTFSSDDEVIAMANGAGYGLG